MKFHIHDKIIWNGKYKFLRKIKQSTQDSNQINWNS